MAQDETNSAGSNEPANTAPAPSVAPTAAAVSAANPPVPNDVEVAMEAMLKEAEQEATAAAPKPSESVARPATFSIPTLTETSTATPFAGIELLDDVELDVKIELGRTEMYIEDVLRLGVGSVVELDRLAGDPVDIYVNERLVARGEVLVLNDNFCVRVNDIINPLPELEAHR